MFLILTSLLTHDSFPQTPSSAAQARSLPSVGSTSEERDVTITRLFVHFTSYCTSFSITKLGVPFVQCILYYLHIKYYLHNFLFTLYVSMHCGNWHMQHAYYCFAMCSFIKDYYILICIYSTHLSFWVQIQFKRD